ncbi:dihydrolipoamide acetyltransferase family protein [Agromyces aerolatus]|uniref:dihydrolipoamide acetyltransferase family protein n=1 Tax=Agromyces sp. LY-1074 TaxID=3074080 RepID=UPI0028618F15|nr:MULTISPECIES: dihydrolipoamide acetyltransferase family protein [unclassified Agromyces]MDR5700048.1 dihydrolipoamide acetyltransferase family protein [Agromyces sp. LY-1074]MDR5706584.1 dihydrolipoamide acetyltransferase family protein [Agromyces sp. LY-1358]
MSRSFTMPDLGEGLTEAEVVSWLVAPGDRVAIDQPVVELESAKSVVQLPSPFAGVVEAIGGEVGQVLHTGDVLLTLAEPARSPGAPGEATIPDVPGRADAPGRAHVPGGADASGPTGSDEESGAVLIGYGTRPAAVAARRAPASGRFGRRGGAPAGSSDPASDPERPAVLLDAARRSPVLSPIVRRLAREHGFDASRLLGSGPDHLVMRRDVEHAIAEREGAREGVGAGVSPDAGGASPRVPDGPARDEASPAPDAHGVHRVPLDRHALAAAAQFERSRREIPDATVWLDVDATGLLAARRELERATGERFGVTALVARFALAGLARHPRLNGSYDAEHRELVLHDHVNLGIATQTARGLLVPVVHGVHVATLRELRDAIAARAEQASTGAFPPDALRGGTFTLNNYGALGVDGSAAILNHPEAAMLGIGRLIERPWVVDGALAVRTVTELTLSFDHRVCDGAEAAAFLTFVAACIERPVSLLADL